jgi:hypothetical protein
MAVTKYDVVGLPGMFGGQKLTVVKEDDAAGASELLE